MSSHPTKAESGANAPLDLSKWKKVPYIVGAIGLVGAIIGFILDPRQFGFTYLTAYIYFLSLCVGGLFLVMIHHLFDAAWSVPLRRLSEHLAVLLFPTMAILFIPIALLAPTIYPWMTMDPHTDHALHAKHALLNMPAWYLISAACFLVWWGLSRRLRAWSLRQDETGSAQCTYKLRFHSCWGMFMFAVSVTMAIMLWVKSLEHQWFSTMYGVYYFAESVWTTLATIYLLSLVLKRSGPLKNVVQTRQFHDLGVLWFAFTVFYAYIHFSQYFIIWNANIPEETFWYIKREQGTWWQFGMLLIFGHFFLPFLALLRINAKVNHSMTIPLAIWTWLMHFCDISFNIMPVLLPDGYNQAPLSIVLVLCCMAFIGAVLVVVWLKHFASHAAYPVKDPRLAEALGIYVPPGQTTYVAAQYEGKQ
ncbi:MAG: hypothetical protein ACK4UN_07355 [Limisphaerales bacterium]